jgi:hypothetical protein
MRNRTFSEKFWEDKHGKFVVWQKPNVCLWTWIISMFVNLFVPNGIFHEIVGWVSLVALVIWAFLEVFRGVDYFRRLLGLMVLMLLIVVRI